MSLLRSPLFYVGDKYKLIEKIKDHFPPKIDRFIEPFTGGGSVFLNTKARVYLLNDIDKEVILLHKFLSSQAKDPADFFKKIHQIVSYYRLSRSYKEDIIPERLKKLWPKTYYARFNKKAYNSLKGNFNRAKKKDLIKLYLLLIYGFNRMLRFNTFGNFNLPVGNVDFNKNVTLALKQYFAFVKNKDIKFFNKDFKDFLTSIHYQKNDFLYVDPPYLITFSEYNKLWNDKREKELLEMLSRLDKKNIKFALSNVTHYKGKKNPVLIKWMKKYRVSKISSNYISYHNNSSKEIEEVLITNYE